MFESSLYQKQIQTVAELPIAWEMLSNSAFLISGASGMIGTFLVDVLMRRGDVAVIALGRNLEKAKKRFRFHWGKKLFSFFCQDVNTEFPMKGKYDYIVHAASNTHPIQYATSPISTITSNVIGLKHMLDIATAQNKCRFLYISSVEVYGENRGDAEAYDENYCGYINPNTLRAGYPESKRCGEALCQAYIAEKALDIVVARLSRVYGPTMTLSDSKALSQFITSALSGCDITLKSKGDQLYSYTYVADAVSALLYILLYGERGHAYNAAAGGDSNIALRDLSQILADTTGTKVIFKIPDEIEKRGYSTATRAVLDSSKLNRLGWKPFYQINKGLQSTIAILQES